jgi:hypothetical protein
MKTSIVAAALARQIIATAKLFEAGGPAAAHPLTGAVRNSLEASHALAEAIRDDAIAREASAEAARDDSSSLGAKFGEREPPLVFGGPVSTPPNAPAPTGRGVVSIDDVLASAAADPSTPEPPAVPAGSP